MNLIYIYKWKHLYTEPSEYGKKFHIPIHIFIVPKNKITIMALSWEFTRNNLKIELGFAALEMVHGAQVDQHISFLIKQKKSKKQFRFFYVYLGH